MAVAVGERLPFTWAILIPWYTKTLSDFAEERAREVLSVPLRFGDLLNRCSEVFR
jgi:hypothetical protein